MKQIIILMLFFSFGGCELYKQDSFQQVYVVESYLVAYENLPRVLLSTTTPAQESYSFEDAAVAGAEVEIRLLNADSTTAEIYQYREAAPGIYTHPFRIRVQPERLYQLLITTPSGDTVESKTFVPEYFETVNEVRGQYVYQSGQQIEITTTPSDYYTGRQAFYIFTVEAINPSRDNLTPFYRDLVANQDISLQNYFINSSGIINEANYESSENGNITLSVPWLAVAFYGSNNITVNAIDDNMYDFLRSQSAQSGGSTLAPGEIQNIEYNVNGGIGIFGSMSRNIHNVSIIRAN